MEWMNDEPKITGSLTAGLYFLKYLKWVYDFLILTNKWLRVFLTNKFNEYNVGVLWIMSQPSWILMIVFVVVDILVLNVIFEKNVLKYSTAKSKYNVAWMKG